MKSSRALAALSLLVLGAVLARAVDWHEDLLFAEWARFSESTAQAGLSNDYERADVKHLCLKESKQYNCQSVGCTALSDCATSNCTSCATHIMAQSDLVCCDDEHKHHHTDASDLFTPQLRVGTCDWDLDIYTCLLEDGCTQDAIPLKKGAKKLGTAWATCYLNADAEQCGHPFCDKMVLTFKGGAYRLIAYAKSPQSPQGTCFGTVGESGKGSAENQAKQSGLSKVLDNAGLYKKLRELHPSIQYTGGGSSGNISDYEVGIATLFSGSVTVTSMTHHVEYGQGMLEYVGAWTGGQPVDTPVPSGLVVKPYAYDVVLTRTKEGYGSKEGGEGTAEVPYHEGTAREGYPREEDHGEGYHEERRDGYFPYEREGGGGRGGDESR